MSTQIIPPPTDPYEGLYWNMVRAHDPFKIGYDHIVPLLQDPPMDDLRNLLGYIDAWAQSIVAHHDTEELSVFPILAKKMDLNQEQEQHKVIHAGISKLIEYLDTCKKDHAQFNAEKILGMLQDMKDPLFQHLEDEVRDIVPEKMRAAGWTEDELRTLVGSLTSEAQKHGDPFLLLPFMMSHTPPEHKSFPAAPWVLKKVLIPYVFAKRHSGYWKWAPYSMS